LGNEKNSFDTSEAMYATVPATGLTVRLYVVADKSNWTDGDPLADVSVGGFEQLTLSTDGTQVVKIWDPPLSLGNYDIVEDVNCNGVYDEGIDLVDSITVVGAVVVPEFQPVGILAVLMLLALAAVSPSRRRSGARNPTSIVKAE
jgi:hypothetical protein